MSNIPIFVINLERCPDRMRFIADRFDQLGLTYERFPAFDGSNLDLAFVEQHYPNLLEDARAGGGGVGGLLSHFEVAKLILSRGLERACVVEDDAEFDTTFPVFVDEKTAYPACADTIKLEAAMRRKFVLCSVVKRVGGRLLAYVPANNAAGAASYILTRQGAQKLVEASQKVRYVGIDHFIFTYELSGMKPLHILPYPSRQSGLFPSTISTYPTDIFATSAPKPSPVVAQETSSGASPVLATPTIRQKIDLFAEKIGRRLDPKRKPWRRRRTMREVIEIRSRRSREVFRAFLNSRRIVGAGMFRLTVASVQSGKGATE